MKRVFVWVLLLVGTAVAGDDDVATWVKKLGTSDQKHPFEAMQTLIRIGEPVIPAVHKVFRDDKNPTRRWHAAKVLGAVKARAAVADLLVGVEDPNAIVAACAAEALGGIGDRSVLPKLKALEAESKRPNVKAQITKAIEALSGGASDVLAFPWIPWADTIEAARARAKDEKKLVLAFVTPWDNKAWEAGYEGAREVAEFRRPNQAAPAPAPITRDPGHWKERAILTAFLGDPAVSNLVATCFVPVRVRMHTWHFLSSGKGTWSDPLPRLGTSAAQSHAPAVVFATPSGKCVHRVVRMAVFDPRLFERTCRAVLDKNKRYRPKDMPKAGGDPADPKDRADYDRALAALEKGDTDRAHDHLRAIARRGEPRPLEARARLLLDENGPFPRVWGDPRTGDHRSASRQHGGPALASATPCARRSTSCWASRMPTVPGRRPATAIRIASVRSTAASSFPAPPFAWTRSVRGAGDLEGEAGEARGQGHRAGREVRLGVGRAIRRPRSGT